MFYLLNTGGKASNSIKGIKLIILHCVNTFQEQYCTYLFVHYSTIGAKYCNLYKLKNRQHLACLDFKDHATFQDLKEFKLHAVNQAVLIYMKKIIVFLIS